MWPTMACVWVVFLFLWALLMPQLARSTKLSLLVLVDILDVVYLMLINEFM